MDSRTIAIGLVVIAAFSLVRIITQWRGASRKRRTIDWDEHFIQQLRKAGVNTFEDQDIDFFFTVPASARREPLLSVLRSEGFMVDVKQASDSTDFSVHAQRRMRLAVPEMKEIRVHFNELAAAHGATYDNWAVALKK